MSFQAGTADNKDLDGKVVHEPKTVEFEVKMLFVVKIKSVFLI